MNLRQSWRWKLDPFLDDIEEVDVVGGEGEAKMREESNDWLK